MSAKNDRWIREQAAKGMISPFECNLVSKIHHPYLDKKVKALSYGTSSFGYDLRLSPNSFFRFKRQPGQLISPKSFNPASLVEETLYHDEEGSYFVIPGNSYCLGVAVEKLRVPRGIIVICVGKSTYARLGIIVNVTPAEPEWEGNLTLEFSNSQPNDCKLFVNEGVCQAVFIEGEDCETSYLDRGGKYQSQKEIVTFPR